MRIHFPSVAVGVAAVALILVSMSQANPPASQARIEYGPHPRDMIHVTEGVPYVVPTGRLFVLTGLGCSSAESRTAVLRVDGSIEVIGGIAGEGGTGTSLRATISSVAPMPPGLTVPAGLTIEVDDGLTNATTGRAWGYLANQ